MIVGDMEKIDQIEGVCLKILKRHKDDRGYFEELIRVTDPIFSEGFGQLSRSSMHKGVIKAWHVHKTQIDWWYCASGTLNVGLYDTRKEVKTYKNLFTLKLGEQGQEAILKIPPQVAHGLLVTSDHAELFYITSKVYNPAQEEGRIPEDDSEIAFDWKNFRKL